MSSKEKSLGYYFQVVFYSIVAVVCVVASLVLLFKSVLIGEDKVIKYQESSDIDYKVILKPNDTYDTPYLKKEEGVLYLASLIDTIDFDFDYVFNIEDPTDVDFTYSIYAKLTIADSSSNNTYYEKEYQLLEPKKVSMVSSTEKQIHEKFSIDYGYYNALANDFKMTYAVATNSNLTVYIKIDKDHKEKGYTLTNGEASSINIPLSEKSINIQLDYNAINDGKEVIEKVNPILDKNLSFFIIFVALLVLLFSLYKVIKLLVNGEESAFDKQVAKLLREYDRLIVETSTAIDLNRFNIIKIEQFEELLDVRDNLKLPVLYYCVRKHQVVYFYIKHHEDLYLLVLKASSMGK